MAPDKVSFGTVACQTVAEVVARQRFVSQGLQDVDAPTVE
jgi:hypothetical protein